VRSSCCSVGWPGADSLPALNAPKVRNAPNLGASRRDTCNTQTLRVSRANGLNAARAPKLHTTAQAPKGPHQPGFAHAKRDGGRAPRLAEQRLQAHNVQQPDRRGCNLHDVCASGCRVGVQSAQRVEGWRLGIVVRRDNEARAAGFPVPAGRRRGKKLRRRLELDVHKRCAELDGEPQRAQPRLLWACVFAALPAGAVRHDRGEPRGGEQRRQISSWRKALEVVEAQLHDVRASRLSLSQLLQRRRERCSSDARGQQAAASRGRRSGSRTWRARGCSCDVQCALPSLRARLRRALRHRRPAPERSALQRRRRTARSGLEPRSWRRQAREPCAREQQHLAAEPPCEAGGGATPYALRRCAQDTRHSGGARRLGVVLQFFRERRQRANRFAHAAARTRVANRFARSGPPARRMQANRAGAARTNRSTRAVLECRVALRCTQQELLASHPLAARPTQQVLHAHQDRVLRV
jgi:hypothetical protein